MLVTIEDVLSTTLGEFVEKMIIAKRCKNFNLYVGLGELDNCNYAFYIRDGEMDDYQFEALRDYYLLPEIKEECDPTRFVEYSIHVCIYKSRLIESPNNRIWSDGPFLKPPHGYKTWNLKPIIPTVVNIGDPVFKYNYNPNPCYDPEKIISHDPATIIIWRDGSKTVVKCQNGEPYDLEKGIAMCYMKKVNGNKPKYYDIFKTGEKKGVIKYGERKGV